MEPQGPVVTGTPIRELPFEVEVLVWVRVGSTTVVAVHTVRGPSRFGC